MTRPRDGIAICTALLLHAGIAGVMLRAHMPSASASSVELQLTTPPSIVPIPSPAPIPVPRPSAKLHATRSTPPSTLAPSALPRSAAPATHGLPAPPDKEGLPVPSGPPSGPPLGPIGPEAPSPSKLRREDDGGGGRSAAIRVRSYPRIDEEACARHVSYPTEAQEAGIEGSIELRVSVDERGHVTDVHLLSGLGHGLDQAAMNALRYRCSFEPAIDTSGKPVAYVIPLYTWTFELPR